MGLTVVSNCVNEQQVNRALYLFDSVDSRSRTSSHVHEM